MSYNSWLMLDRLSTKPFSGGKRAEDVCVCVNSLYFITCSCQKFITSIMSIRLLCRQHTYFVTHFSSPMPLRLIYSSIHPVAYTVQNYIILIEHTLKIRGKKKRNISWSVCVCALNSSEVKRMYKNTLNLFITKLHFCFCSRLHTFYILFQCFMMLFSINTKDCSVKRRKSCNSAFGFQFQYKKITRSFFRLLSKHLRFVQRPSSATHVETKS